MTITLSTKGLSAGWSDKRLFSDFDIELDFSEYGHCLPIVGRTGLGKSTLLYVLAGMAQPQSGRVRWHLPKVGRRGSEDHWQDVSWTGENGSGFKDASVPRSRNFGFLLQDAAMIPCFTVQENMLHSMRLRGVSGSRKEKLERVKRSIAAMAIEGENVEHLRHIYPGRLSGGQRQRMALATATVHDPSVLFADEPTASLDDETGIQVLRAVRQWLDNAERPGKRCFVFVTHGVRLIRRGIEAEQMVRLRNHSSGGDVANLDLQLEATPVE